jgi:hypothetical protein
VGAAQDIKKPFVAIAGDAESALPRVKGFDTPEAARAWAEGTDGASVYKVTGRDAGGKVKGLEPVQSEAGRFQKSKPASAATSAADDAGGFVKGLDEGLSDLPEPKDIGPETIDFTAEGGKAGGGRENIHIADLAGKEGARNLIDGIKITDGKVGGKIPIDEYEAIRQSSIKNPNADSLTLGKFTDDATSYIQRAGTNSSYFDLGSDWSSIKQKYGLNNNEMFHYFNRPALGDAIAKGKTIRFSHNPLDYGGSFLADEWEYIKETLSLTDVNLLYDGGFWYVR